MSTTTHQTVAAQVDEFEADAEAYRNAIATEAAKFLADIAAGDLDIVEATLALGDLFTKVEGLGIAKGVAITALSLTDPEAAALIEAA